MLGHIAQGQRHGWKWHYSVWHRSQRVETVSSTSGQLSSVQRRAVLSYCALSPHLTVREASFSSGLSHLLKWQCYPSPECLWAWETWTLVAVTSEGEYITTEKHLEELGANLPFSEHPLESSPFPTPAPSPPHRRKQYIHYHLQV